MDCTRNETLRLLYNNNCTVNRNRPIVVYNQKQIYQNPFINWYDSTSNGSNKLREVGLAKAERPSPSKGCWYGSAFQPFSNFEPLSVKKSGIPFLKRSKKGRNGERQTLLEWRLKYTCTRLTKLWLSGQQVYSVMPQERLFLKNTACSSHYHEENLATCTVNVESAFWLFKKAQIIFVKYLRLKRM